MYSKYDLIVVGGGAAGFFAAISAAANCTGIKVCILEKSSKLLSKVKISGGGRCNVTHACYDNNRLLKNYPRGSKELKKTFEQFSARDTVKWFESRGVKLKEELDGRVFPISDNSQTIIDCLLKECQKFHIDVFIRKEVVKIAKSEEGFEVKCLDSTYKSKKLLIASGGNPKMESYSWIKDLGHSIIPPVPSLFTFNVPTSDIKDLQGISMPGSTIKIIGQKLEQSGPTLITHWGFSGPGILRLSAWGARLLSSLNYDFSIYINWIGAINEDELRLKLQEIQLQNPKKGVEGNPFFGIPKRLWEKIIQSASIEPNKKWIELSKKQLNKLLENLYRSEYKVKGKTTFKDEFVTCGGVKLSEVDFRTLESKISPGLYFAGEVLDIDGITGGFNFQNAWSTGYIAGKNAAR